MKPAGPGSDDGNSPNWKKKREWIISGRNKLWQCINSFLNWRISAVWTFFLCLLTGSEIYRWCRVARGHLGRTEEADVEQFCSHGVHRGRHDACTAAQSSSVAAPRPKWVFHTGFKMLDSFLLFIRYGESSFSLYRFWEIGSKMQCHQGRSNGRGRDGWAIECDRKGERSKVQLVAEKERCMKMTPRVSVPAFAATYMTGLSHSFTLS